MNIPNFDYKGALDAGYSEDEINSFLKEKSNGKIKVKVSDTNPNFDYAAAFDAGYTPDEVDEFLESQKPKRSLSEKIGRLAGQFAIGAAESAALPYEIAVAPLAIPGGQESLGNLFTGDILSEVYPEGAEERMIGRKELKEPINLGIRSLAEKATGVDLHPEGIAEKAASWTGFLKNPSSILSLAKSGLKPKDAFKAIAPTGTEVMRGLGAGTALQAAEEGEFGPIGTMASAVVGDLAGGGAAAVLKGGAKLAKGPKKALAEAFAKFTPNEKLGLQKEIIQDFRNAGIQADLGTITDSNLIKWIQSRLAQSGL